MKKKKSAQTMTAKKFDAATSRKFAAYRRRCQRASESLGLALDLLADDDPYETDAEMREAFATRVPAADFVRQAFAEDLADQGYDEVLFQESLEAAADYQDYEDNVREQNRK